MHADRAILLADVADGLFLVAKLTHETLHRNLALLVEIVRGVALLIIAATVVVHDWALLLLGLAGLFFQLGGDGLDCAGHDEALLVSALAMVVVFAGSFTLQNGLVRDESALLGVIHEEEANLANVTV